MVCSIRRKANKDGRLTVEGRQKSWERVKEEEVIRKIQRQKKERQTMQRRKK